MPKQSTLVQFTIIGILIAGLIMVISITIGIGSVFTQSNPTPSAPKKTLTIGILQYAPVSNILTKGFKQGMQELGYIEGNNIQYVEAEQTLDNDLLAQNAAGIVSENVDLIFATTSVAGIAALKATSDIPIVWIHAAQAVRNGLAEDYKSSGNNSTGIEIDFAELTRKKMEFLIRIDPTIQKIGILDPVAKDFATLSTLPVVIEEAPKYDIELVKYPITSLVDTEAKEEIAQAFENVEPGDIDAYIYIPGPATAREGLNSQIDFTKRLQIPSFWLTQDEVIKGGLFTYEYDNIAMGKQSAVQVNKVLQGTHPSDIPIEFPAKNSLIVNFNTLNELGITLPDDILQIVDIRIEN